VILGNPALRRLALLKLRGSARRHLRRMRSLSGFLFILLGLALMSVWIGSVLLSRGALSRGPEWEGLLLRSTTQFGIAFVAGITLTGALTVRGLYLPKQEIERLFSSPVSRSDLIRYRMQVDLGRTLLGGIVLGILVHRRMPVGVFGFAGAFLTVMTLAVLRQTASLLLGDVRGRLGRLLRRRKLVVVQIALGVLAWLGAMVLIFGQGFFDGFAGIGSERGLDSVARDLLLNPWAQSLLLPFRPWAEAMVAVELGTFLVWGSLSTLLFLGLYELTARLPIDYREQSLETSEEVATRLSSMRRGGPFGLGRVSPKAAARRVPWPLGRGPLRAVMWVKTAAMLRKARGTLFVALGVVLLVTVAMSAIAREEGRDGDALGPALVPLFIGLFGMVYLAGALRFDFRAELDRMEQLKSWPIAPARLFLASLLPETVLIWILLSAAVLVRAVVLDAMHPVVWGVVLALPFATLGWLAIDNAVFLFAPVRFVPGQEGALHHTGRAMVLLLLRMLVFLVAGTLVGLAAGGAAKLGESLLELDSTGSLALAAGAGILVLLLVDAVLVAVGGRMLRRFDVARDRA
jgi:hypothetical protein